MGECCLEIVASLSELFEALIKALDKHRVDCVAEPPHTIVVKGEYLGDVEDLLCERVYEEVIGTHYHLTCDEADDEQATRDYLKSHGIPFIEHRFEGDLAFIINRRHDPNDWD